MSAIVGRYTYGAEAINYRWQKRSIVDIGAFCSFAPNITIFLDSDHTTQWVTTYPFGAMDRGQFQVPMESYAKYHEVYNADRSVFIGNDVWVGEGATIMGGVTIGDGAIVAANSHVVKDVAPYSIVGGNPARHIRYRFTDEQVEKLFKIKWWNWPDEAIEEALPLLCSDDIDKFIEKYLPRET